ncbi:hypothetical protein HJFPF1_09192 [Paramyrothecium foliicola]|nr:hypothetical protein HJFPF1_09192 [Paramyrothecium foliicola]
MSEADWKWFPTTRDGWGFDIVTLLAVIGESSISDHAQNITASLLGVLPRIIPAPQALLKPSRPVRMPEVKAKMTGVYNGTTLDTIGFFANIITPLEALPAHSFKVIHIKHADWTKNPHEKKMTLVEKLEVLLTSPGLLRTDERPAVPPKLSSPIHILSVVSFLVSIAITVAAVFWKDGPALLAIPALSLVSSITGVASLWRPVLMVRKHRNEVPRGDVLIRTREAAFVLVKCTEDVARELYSGTELCDYYLGENAYRMLMGLGTVLLMVSVVLLGNCTWSIQLFIGGSYIALNGLYWCLGMLPASYFWNLSRYEWRDETPKDALDAHKVSDLDDWEEGRPSFTRTLWYIIRETQLTGWAERSGAAPNTDQWKRWLREAEHNAISGNRRWPAVRRKDALMKEGVLKENGVREPEPQPPAVQVAP